MPEAVLTVKGSIRQRKVEDLKPHPKNARVHSEEQVGLIMNAITEFGFMVPVVVDEDTTILAGHGRWEAAKKLGMTKIPTIDAKHLTDAQKRAFIIADNKLVERGGWDIGLLSSEVVELNTLDVDISALGISTEEFSDFKRRQKGKDPEAEDDVPEAEEVAVSRTGDVWVCGGHRLLCGDATVEEDVAKVFDGDKPLLMVTDPPYGVEYDPDWRNRVDRASGKPYGARAVGQFSNDDRVDWRDAWALFSGSVAYCWHAGRYASTVQASLEAAGFEIRSQIIWNKPRFVISRGNYHWQHEPCWYAVRKGSKANWCGNRSQTTIWSVEHQKSETGHSTQKPVEVMRRPILNHTKDGESVYDPFLGSGTTMIAAESVGRICYGIDIDPVYVDVAVKRWQEYTGEKATLENDGRSFDEVAEERTVPPPRKRTRAKVVPGEADETEGDKT